VEHNYPNNQAPSSSQVQLAEMSMPYESDQHYVDYCVHGFGYDRVMNDYMVIRYGDVYGDPLGRMINTNIRPVWEIYSLRSNF
jgi:hypothetical protein